MLSINLFLGLPFFSLPAFAYSASSWWHSHQVIRPPVTIPNRLSLVRCLPLSRCLLRINVIILRRFPSRQYQHSRVSVEFLSFTLMTVQHSDPYAIAGVTMSFLILSLCLMWHRRLCYIMSLRDICYKSCQLCVVRP